MKLSFCFLTAVAAIDRPTISLDLDESKLVHRTTCKTENGCNLAKTIHTRHAVNVANKQLSSYVHSCVAKKDTKTTCPLPQAKAYDHHDGLLAKVDYKIYLVNNDGKPAVQHTYKCSGTSKAENNCINYNLRSEWIARYDAADASGNSAEQVVFAIILNDPIAPKWTTTTWKLHSGKHCGGTVGGTYGTSITTWADGTSANYGQKKMANLKQCQAECARHADCSGFVQRDSDNNCNFWKGGKLAPFKLNGHHCYQKQTGVTTKFPTAFPTAYPTHYPTRYPTRYPTAYPTAYPTHDKQTQKHVAGVRKNALKTRAPTPLPTKTNKFSKTKTHKDTTTNAPTLKNTAMPTVKPTAAPTRRALSQCNWSKAKKVVEGWRGAGYGKQYCNLYHCNKNGKLSVVGKKRPCGHKPSWADKKCTHTKCYYRNTKESPKEKVLQVIGHHKEKGGKSHSCVYMLPKALKGEKGMCSCYCWGKPNTIWAPAVKGAKF